MKALIRKSNETIIESDGIVGIDWDTGVPLTNESWAGGPYRLVENYQKSTEDYHESADGEAVEDAVHDSARAPVEVPEEPEPIQSTPVEEKSAEQPSEALPETVTYGGKEYTLEELKKLIG